MGISKHSAKRFNNYFQPRSFCVNKGKSYFDKIPQNFSIPQGSYAGPILWAVTMQYIVPADMSLHRLADDYAIKLSFSANIISAEATTPSVLEYCANAIKLWKGSNCLKLPSSKLEFILFHHLKQLQKCFQNNLRVDVNSSM